MKKEGRPIIVVKKRAHGHAGHHGGAWKVAYADFVTAMMAFFLVMWIISMDSNVRQSIEGYFSNPIGFKKGYSAGASPVSSGSSPGTVHTSPLRLVNRQEEERVLSDAGGQIRERLDSAGLGSIGERIEIVRTKMGLRIELAEDATGDVFFALASSRMRDPMRNALDIIGQELSRLHNAVIIEGHTDAAQFAGVYTNWELSSDRANAARRVLEAAGLHPNRIVEVRGHADRQLRNPENPLDPRNRRITIVLPFLTAEPDQPTIVVPAG